VKQKPEESRDIIKTLDMGWDILSALPKEALDRVSPETLAQFYHEKS
jgi:V/A-type H+-transporting ATPase subunit B